MIRLREIVVFDEAVKLLLLKLGVLLLVTGAEGIGLLRWQLWQLLACTLLHLASTLCYSDLCGLWFACMRGGHMVGRHGVV